MDDPFLGLGLTELIRCLEPEDSQRNRWWVARFNVLPSRYWAKSRKPLAVTIVRLSNTGLQDGKWMLCPVRHRIGSVAETSLQSETLVRYRIVPKVKVKSLCLTKHHAMKTYWGSGRIAPCSLNLVTRLRLVVSFTPRPLYPRERSSDTHCIGGWMGPRAGLDRVARRKISNRAGNTREYHHNSIVPIWQPLPWIRVFGSETTVRLLAKRGVRLL
jgi:hypothetical protein